MPELPDVEVFRQYLEATSLKQTIEKAEVREPSMVKSSSGSELSRSLKDRFFVSAVRQGKYLAAQLDNHSWLILHFGMTGYLQYFKDQDADTPHNRLKLLFKNRHCLIYDCRRKLGQIRLIKDLEAFWRSADCGPDVLNNLDAQGFIQRLSGRRGQIKSALMDQSLFCGIGNIYSDEILFQTGIHPKTPVKKLDPQDMRRLYSRMIHVLEKAVQVQADPKQMPDKWLIPRREKGQTCPVCGASLERIRASGRGSWICPGCQKL